MVKKRKKTPTKKNTFLLCLNLDTFKSLNFLKTGSMGTFNRYVTLLGVGEVVGFVTNLHGKKEGEGV